MADQAINALSTKTAPETSDQLLLVGTGEPQLIDYDKLADAILNKITSKNYALDAGQMTLLAALNKLNSECSKIIIAEKKNGIFTATFNIYRSAGYKSAMVFSTDGTNGFFHLVLIPPTTTQCEYITVWEHNENTISYTYDFSTGTLTLKSTGIIYGGITCICGL